jgi:NADPH:quinone reductase-like Zn-dependent oxidoreductase
MAYLVQVNPVTAVAFFKMLKIPEGEFLIQTAAHSTLGKQVIALAKNKKIKTINLVRRSDAKEKLLALGYGQLLFCTSNIADNVVVAAAAAAAVASFSLTVLMSFSSPPGFLWGSYIPTVN